MESKLKRKGKKLLLTTKSEKETLSLENGTTSKTLTKCSALDPPVKMLRNARIIKQVFNHSFEEGIVVLQERKKNIYFDHQP